MTKTEYVDIMEGMTFKKGDKIHVTSKSHGIDDDFIVQKVVPKGRGTVRLYLKAVRLEKA